MAGTCQSNRKELLKKKDGERNLHFPSCPPDVQAALRETRHAEWKKWIKFNAGVIFTDEEVRQLTDAGCEIYPIQWIEVDKNAHLRRDSDDVSVTSSRGGGAKMVKKTEEHLEAEKNLRGKQGDALRMAKRELTKQRRRYKARRIIQEVQKAKKKQNACHELQCEKRRRQKERQAKMEGGG